MSSSIEIEMPLNYNMITQYNLQVDYTRKLLKKLKLRKTRSSKTIEQKVETVPRKSEKKLTNENNYSEWRNENGELHRENDLPALTRSNGTKQWWVNGKLHRENDLPAIIHSNGVKEWWFNGRPFRQNKKPIIEGPNDCLINELLYSINKSVRKNSLKK